MKDILLTSDNDLQIASNDLVIGESTRQHQKMLLINPKGSYKDSPLSGVGIDDYLNNEDPGAMIRMIRRQFVQDGMSVTAITYTYGQLIINANYN